MLRQHNPKPEQAAILTHQSWVQVGRHIAKLVSPEQPKAFRKNSILNFQSDATTESQDLEALKGAYRTVAISDAMAKIQVSSLPNALVAAPSLYQTSLLQSLQARAQQVRQQIQFKVKALLTRQYTDDSEAPSEKPFALNFVGKPMLLTSLAISLTLVAVLAYVGLGYWLLMAENPSQAAEPLSSSHGELKLENNQSSLDNLQKLQKQTQGGIVVPDEKPAASESTTRLIAMAQSPLDKLLPGLPPIQKEMTGRSDPFMPLVQEGDNAVPQNNGPKDILNDLSFTGFIGDAHLKDKTAIIQVLNAGTPQTLIKKAGESFVVDGEQVFLKNVGTDAVILSLHGKSRRVALTPFVDTVAASNGNGNAAKAGSTLMAPSAASTGNSVVPNAGTGTSNTTMGTGSTGSDGPPTLNPNDTNIPNRKPM